MNAVVERLGSIGIVPVIKLDDPAVAVDLGRALVAGGLPAAEVTFRTPVAAAAIRAMVEGVPELLVGAGTVTRVEQVQAAREAGAKFVVCPCFDDAVVDRCLEAGIPVLPGVNGPDGVARGVARGLSVLKFFPAEASGGVAMLDALAGPFGEVKFVPTGGIDGSNLAEYARRSSVHAVGGSWMVKASLLEARDWKGVERRCREAMLALHGFAFAHVGVNGDDVETASAAASALAALFGLATAEGSSSIFVDGAIELTKEPFRGTKGHLALRCHDVERATAWLGALGVKVVPGTEKVARGKIASVYLDLEIAGFALHLVRG